MKRCLIMDEFCVWFVAWAVKQRERDDENSQSRFDDCLRNPMSWGRQPSDTYKSCDYASRDTAHRPVVDSKKMWLDWSRWYIAVHFRIFPRLCQPGANFLCDCKKIYIHCVCSYIYLYWTHIEYIWQIYTL